MTSAPIIRRLIACGFALTITLAFPCVASARQSADSSIGTFSKISNNTSDGMLIARGGGGRGGGGGRSGGGRSGGGRGGGGRSGGGRAGGSRGGSAGLSALRSGGLSRPSGGIRSSISKPSHGISRAGSPSRGQQVQRPQAGQQLPSSAMRPRPSQPVANPGQRPGNLPANAGQRPNNPRMNAGSGRLPNQLPNNAQRPGNLPNRPSNISEINASRSVNVEGYDGGWGYHGEDYPWGLGAAAGLAGFTLGSVLNSLPANSQPVVIQGQPYYESDGMYFESSSGGGYTVVPPPTGAIETQLPSGAKPVSIGGHELYEVQGVYYQQTIHNGQPAYMVVTP